MIYVSQTSCLFYDVIFGKHESFLSLVFASVLYRTKNLSPTAHARVGIPATTQRLTLWIHVKLRKLQWFFYLPLALLANATRCPAQIQWLENHRYTMMAYHSSRIKHKPSKILRINGSFSFIFLYIPEPSSCICKFYFNKLILCKL